MSEIINQKVRDLVPYDPIEGEYRIRLDANESFLPAPLPADGMKTIEAAVSRTAWNRYPDPLAREVCAAFAGFYGVPEEYLTACNASDESIFLLFSAFLMKGDAFLTLAPDFSMYRFYGEIVEGEGVCLPKREDLSIDVDAVIRTVREKDVKLVIFSNPCNPTSLGLDRGEVRRLIREVEALVVLDEAYMDFWDQSLLHEVGEYENLVILRTCSKAIGLASLRLGFCVANPALTRIIRAVKSPYNSNTLTQAIGAQVLAQKEQLRENIRRLVQAREELYQGMGALREASAAFHLYESCTNFVFLKFYREQEAGELHAYLLENSIAVRLFPGGYLRITAGSPEENAELLRVMESYWQRGQGK